MVATLQKAAAAAASEDDEEEAASGEANFDYLLNLVLKTLTEEKVRFLSPLAESSTSSLRTCAHTPPPCTYTQQEWACLYLCRGLRLAFVAPLLRLQGGLIVQMVRVVSSSWIAGSEAGGTEAGEGANCDHHQGHRRQADVA